VTPRGDPSPTPQEFYAVAKFRGFTAVVIFLVSAEKPFALVA
jgi:hypothetical protein